MIHDTRDVAGDGEGAVAIGPRTARPPRRLRGGSRRREGGGVRDAAARRRAGGRWHLLAVVAVSLAAAAVGLGARATYGAQLAADEPQYLLSAISLAEDGDLDIADELAAARWRAFHEADLPTQSAVLPDGRRVSPHDPLLPLLLVPGVVVGEAFGSAWAGAKVVIAVLAAALAGLTWWVAVRRFDVPRTTATVGVGAFAASVPLAAYGTQVYPELPAALVVTATVALVTGPPARGRPRRSTVVGTCALLVLLPWLAIKYAPVGAALGAVAVGRWWREGRRGAVGGAVVTALAAAVVWAVVHEQVWTGLTSYASADLFAERGELSAVGFAPDLLGRARRLIGLLTGRDFGLVSWQPAYLLLVPALAALTARRPRGWSALAVPFGAGWLVASFVALTMQGWWVPGRQVVVVLPLGVVAICWWVGTRRRRRLLTGLLAGLGALGMVAWARLAVEASTGRLTLVVDFMDTADPVLGRFRGVLPAYLRMDATQWVLHTLWAVVAAVTIVVAVRRERSQAVAAVTSTGRT